MKPPSYILGERTATSVKGASHIVPAAVREARTAAVRTLRESGVVGARLYDLRWTGSMLREASTGDRLRVLVARVGQGTCGYYDESFVSSTLPFMAVGPDCYLDHATPDEQAQIPERRVDSKVGWLSEAALTSFEGTPAIVATLNPRIGDARIESLIRTARAKAVAYPNAPPFFAMSYAAGGAGAPGTLPSGESGQVISVMTDLESVDVVTASHIGKPLLTESAAVSMSTRVRLDPSLAAARQATAPNWLRRSR